MNKLGLLSVAVLSLLLLSVAFTPITGAGQGKASSTSSASSGTNAPWAYQMQNQQNTGYSPQTMINSSDVASLKLDWSTPIASLAGVPVIVKGVVYVEGTGSIKAVNETTGSVIWTDNRKDIGHSIKTRVGVTVARGTIFAGTTDNDLVSLNASTGALNWIVPIADNVTGSLRAYQGAEATPLVFDGKVIVGETLGDNGARGLLRAFSETNGSLLWTFYTVPPAPINATNQAGYTFPNGTITWGTNGTSGCECGGGAVWNVPAVDPHTGVIYFGTGNPWPFNSIARSPNFTYCTLWSDSVIALNSTNGKVVWSYQEVCDDQYDLDLGMPVQLFNETINGVRTEVVGDGGKPGYYYEFNALNGSLIFRTKVGIHLNDYHTPPGFNGTVYPSSNGGINTLSTYDPSTNMIYTEANNQPNKCGENTKCDNSTLYGINAATGAIEWNLNSSIEAGGVSSTNNIIFTTGNHTLLALNGETGSVLWNYSEPGGSARYRWSWGPPSVTDGMLFFTTWGANGEGDLQAFALPATVNFVESGLPTGESWKVQFDGQWYKGNTSTISVPSVPPGTYDWQVKGSIPSGTGTRYEAAVANGTVTVPQQLTVKVSYNEQYHVKFAVSGNGQVSPSKPGWYESGAVVNITATPGSGSTFVKWVTSPGSRILVRHPKSPKTTAVIDGTGTITAEFSG